MAGLIDDGRLNLFFVKDKELSQVADEVVEIGEVNSSNLYSSTLTTFDVVAEWVCNAKEIEVRVLAAEKDTSVIFYDETRTCTRALNTVDANGFYTVYTPIDVVGISLEDYGSSFSFQTRTGALRPDWYDFNQEVIYQLAGVRASDLLNGSTGVLDFWCGRNEKWYHKHFTIMTDGPTNLLSVRSVTINKSQIVLTQESIYNTRTFTYTITDTFY